MPSVSKAQNAAMWAAREGKSNIGIPQSVGREFTTAQAPSSVKKLPEHVKPAAVHPRTHALTMASASHLHAHGYIGAAQHQSIRNQAQAKMDAHKAQAPAVFGSLAPR
jgi:hypothetical protein